MRHLTRWLSTAGYRGNVNDVTALPSDPAGPLGVVVGSRAHLEQSAAAKRHFLRNFLTKGFHLLVMFVAGGVLRSGGCCLGK